MEELTASAAAARMNAYAPYSVYRVGAAVRGVDGRIYAGCNVENASYGATVCAERAAVFAMVSAGCREVREVAVVTEDGAVPCGICLQVMAEFAPRPDEVPVYCVAADGKSRTFRLSDLLPHGFHMERS